MRILIPAAVASIFICATSQPVFASSSASCRALSPSMAAAVPSIRGFTESLRNIRPQFESALGAFDGEEKAALQLLMDKQTAAYEAMAAFTNQMEDTNYVIQKCAR